MGFNWNNGHLIELCPIPGTELGQSISTFQMGEKKVFTMEEVARKTNPESYMLVIHNKVYDVTNFISEVNKLL